MRVVEDFTHSITHLLLTAFHICLRPEPRATRQSSQRRNEKKMSCAQGKERRKVEEDSLSPPKKMTCAKKKERD